MARLHIRFANSGDLTDPLQSLDVPDVATALVVADINLEHGIAELHDGDRKLARIEKRGYGGRTYWHVD